MPAAAAAVTAAAGLTSRPPWSPSAAYSAPHSQAMLLIVTQHGEASDVLSPTEDSRG